MQYVAIICRQTSLGCKQTQHVPLAHVPHSFLGSTHHSLNKTDFNWVISVILILDLTNIKCMHSCSNLKASMGPLGNLFFPSELPSESPAHHKKLRCAVRAICSDTRNCPESFSLSKLRVALEKRRNSPQRERERERESELWSCRHGNLLSRKAYLEQLLWSRVIKHVF